MTPSSIDLFVTQDCNLRCTYCYIPKKPEKMNAETARAAVDWLLTRAPGRQAKIYFFGGEPMLEFDLMRSIVQYANAAARQAEKRVGFGITSNGTIYTDEIDAFLAANHIGLNLSMDGLPSAHDGHRRTRGGNPTYALVAETLGRLLERNPRQGVRLTYTADNVADLEKNVEHVFSLGARSVFPAPAIETAWTEDRLREYERQLLALARRVIGRTAADYYRVGSIEKAVQKLSRASQRLRHSRRGRYQCGAGHSYLGVAADGSIFPCHRFVGLNAYRLGNVFGDLDDQAINVWSDYDVNSLMPGCYACPARDICSGNCPAVNYAANGRLDVPSLTQCAITRIEARVGRWLLRHAAADLIARMTNKAGCRRKAPAQAGSTATACQR